MAATERDFSDFYLGDNVYQLADGLIPHVADRLEVEVDRAPTSHAIQSVLDVLGRQEKELRENPDVLIGDREETAAIIERAGTQKRLSRSLWTPELAVSEDTVDARIALGGVANWTDRITKLLVDGPDDVQVHLLGGNRVMQGPTEVTNPNVVRLAGGTEKYPTEYEYMLKVALPKLMNANKATSLHQYETGVADDMLKALFTNYPELLNQKLSLVRTANAGVIMALQVRAVARTMNPNFDADSDNPQMFVETDEFPVSRTEEDDKNPVKFQKASTGIKQVVLAAKKLHEVEL